MQGVLEINGLIHTDAGSNELRSIGGCFHSHLLLGIPINGSLVGKVQDASNRPSSDKIKVQVCIHIVGTKGNKLSQRSRHVMRENFFQLTINSVHPVNLLVWESRKIRLFSAKVDCCMLHLDKVGDDVLHSLKVSFPWSDSEPRHRHDSSGDVNSSKRH